MDTSSTLWGAQVSVYEFPGDSGAQWSLAQDSLGTAWGLPEGPVLRGKNARSQVLQKWARLRRQCSERIYYYRYLGYTRAPHKTQSNRESLCF